MSRYYMQRGGKALDHAERDKLLYWYVHTFLWGRYAGSTESVLNQDLAHIEDLNGGAGPADRAAAGEPWRPAAAAQRLPGWSRGARFYPLLYMLTRVHGARDLGSGAEISKHLLGKSSELKMHHVLPEEPSSTANGYTRWRR